MLRKLTISTLALATAAVALASTALASIPLDPGSGRVAPAPSTPDGFPWGDVAIGVALAVALAVCLLGVAFVTRTRRRLAGSH